MAAETKAMVVVMSVGPKNRPTTYRTEGLKKIRPRLKPNDQKV